MGAIYKIPIFNVLDDEGAGYFQVTYNIYTLVLTIATAGIPVALSRLVSTAAARGETGLVKRYFSVALPAFFLIGIITMSGMFLFADELASLMNSSPAATGIRVLAPAVFFVCLISVYRGYAQGFENMIPTAVSQVVEVICKTAFGIAAALWLVNAGFGPNIVSAGAIMGVTIGLGLCIPLLILYKKKIDSGISPPAGHEELPGSFHTFGRIMKVSIPITLSASFMSIMTVMDTGIVLSRLQTWLIDTEEVVKAAAILAAEEGLELSVALAEASEVAASSLFGIFAKPLTVYNLPPALIVPVAVSIIPAIAAALARKLKDEAGEIVRSSIKLNNLLAMPACAGIVLLSGPILITLFNDSRQMASVLMSILGAASFFVCLQLITMAILQASGYERIAMFTFPVGAVIKIILSYILAGNPEIGIIASPVGTLVCFAVISVLNLIFIKVKVKVSPDIFGIFIKPLICAVSMAVMSYFLYRLIYLLGSDIIGTGQFAVAVYLAFTILFAVIFYAVLVIFTRTLTKDDLALVPKGDKLAAILRVK